MKPGLARKLLWRLLLAIAALVASPASAQGFAPGSQCHAGARLDETYAQVAAIPARWTCGARDWSIAPQRVYIRYDLRGVANAARFETRIAPFDALHLTTIEASGRAVSRSYDFDDMTPAAAEWRMSAPLPGSLDGARAVIAGIDRPRFAALLTRAALRAEPQTVPGQWLSLQELGLAAICGLLIGPLLFNLAFYRAMRERFLLWHAAAVAFMLAQTAISGGLAHQLTGLPLSVLSPVATLTFSAGVAAAAMFSASFIETGRIDPVHRRAMRLTAPWIALITALYMAAPEPVRALAPRVYFAGFIPVLIVFAWVIAVALSRGSRAARFQLAAWLPIMLTGLSRIVFNVFSTSTTLDAFWAQNFSVVAEVMITTFGVADRYMILRIERDRARSEARVLANEAESDVLTGLINRRALEQRFTALRDEGFTTMGVIDLDHFKVINDTHGHATGDAVLRAVAEALVTDEDTCAVRYGGEEFVLLLRGANAADRAERCRAAIPARVAAAVEGLDRVVTASMGLVEQAPEVARNRDFAALFAHCDRLLYEAKHNGRNRTMSERLQVFSERRQRSRRSAA